MMLLGLSAVYRVVCLGDLLVNWVIIVEAHDTGRRFFLQVDLKVLAYPLDDVNLLWDIFWE